MKTFTYWLQRIQFNSRLRARILRKIVRFLENSIPLPQALIILYIHATNEGKNPNVVEAVAIDQWHQRIRDGKSFGQAIQGWVPETERLVIKGGENAGNLIKTIEQSLIINHSIKEIKKAIIGGMTYPLVLFTGIIGFLILLGYEVIPEFEAILPRERWTGTGAQMAVLSDFVQNWLMVVLILWVVFIGLCIYTLPRWTGSIRGKFDRVPPWSLYRLIIGSGFLLTVACMLQAGMTIMNILSVLQQNANPYYRERLTKIAQNLKNGHNFGQALYLTDYAFPDAETVQDIRAYSNLNRFNEALEQLGKEWLTDSVQKIQKQASLFKNISIVLAGIVFMWIAFGIFSLQQQITNGI